MPSIGAAQAISASLHWAAADTKEKVRLVSDSRTGRGILKWGLRDPDPKVVQAAILNQRMSLRSIIRRLDKEKVREVLATEADKLMLRKR
jgi:hypothetical protein